MLFVANQEREVLSPFGIDTMAVPNDIATEYTHHVTFVLHLTFHT